MKKAKMTDFGMESAKFPVKKVAAKKKVAAMKKVGKKKM